MSPILRLFLLVLLAAMTVRQGSAQSAEELPQAVRQSMEEALARPLVERYDALYDIAQLHTGDPALLIDALISVAEDGDGGGAEDGDADRRRAARWIAGFCAWRSGKLTQALSQVEKVVPEVPGTLALLAQARLLDSLGRVDDAERAFEAVLAANAGADERLESAVRLRLALLSMEQEEGDKKSGLAAFAGEDGRDPELRNRAANVLALTGRPAEADELYVVVGEGTKRFRDEVRMASWAIAAGEHERAQELAWRARGSAQLTRDRHYALSVLVEAHRMDDSLQALLDAFAAAPELDDPSREVWIDLLRETGQVDAAVELFRASKEEFTVDMQRELVEMYRESGREDLMVATYLDLIAADPGRISWREGLSRHHLERGDTEAARAVWDPLLGDASQATNMLAAGRALVGLSLDDLAAQAAEICIESEVDRYPALLFLFELNLNRGRLVAAEQVLERLDGVAPADDGVRAQLSEAFEQLGKLERAVQILESLRAARGTERLAEDLEMRLAWLYSEVDREDQAMARWYQLWRRVKSVPRRRYVEDRLMTVAARLGQIADIVVDLEEKLAGGQADEQDSGLLVRLYTKVNDPVSATEVIDEFFKQSGGDSLDVLAEKARIYLACTDYANYEDTLRALMKADPEGEGEHLRHLVMSQLERGRPDEAREALTRLRSVEAGSDSAEFEAGVLGLAGLRDDAMAAYRRGISRHPNRIEIYLLLANLMKETGRTLEAVGMFQQLAETADKDDLFTIAIDGLLNMEAPPPVLQWARRITLERMARRHDKMYLYQLLSDLSEELGDREGMLVALEGSLAIAGVRRPSILRELMDLTKGGRGIPGDNDKHLAYGRRMIALAEVVPPQVYLDLGEAFLAANDVRNAVKTFSLAQDLPDYDAFQRQVAALFEKARYLRDALRTYERVMISSPTDVSLLVKVAGLKEQMGRDDVSRELYLRSLELLMARQPLQTEKVEKKPDPTAPRIYFARNIDDFQRYYLPTLQGLLVTLPETEVPAVLGKLREMIAAAVAQVRSAGVADGDLGDLTQYPRVARLSACHRRMAIAFREFALADELDRELLLTYSSDEKLLENLCRERLTWGMVGSARALIEGSNRSERRKEKLRYLVGTGDLAAAGLVPVAQAARLLLPFFTTGDVQAVESLLLKTDLSSATVEDLEQMPVLFSGTIAVGNQNLTLSVARSWMRLMLGTQRGAYEVEQLYRQCRRLLGAEHRRSFEQSLVALIIGDLEKAKDLIRLLPELQKGSEDPILDAEQITELLGKQRLEYPHGLGPILALLPEDERASTVRTLWEKVPKTARVRFLLTIASEFREPIGPSLTEFIVGSLEDSLRDDGEKFLYYEHYLDQMQRNDANVDAARAIAEAMLRVRPQEFTPRMLHAATLQEQGELEQAVKVAVAAVAERINVPEEHYWRRAVDQVAERFLPKHLADFLAAIDAVEKPTPVISRRRLDLVARCNDREAMMAALEKAVAEQPKDRILRQRLRREYDQAGKRLQGLQVMEELVQQNPKDATARRQLSRGWLALRHPIRALAALGETEAERQKLESGGPLGRTGAIRSGSVRAMAVGQVAFVTMSAGGRPAPQKDDDDPNKMPRPSIQMVKKAVDGGDDEAARVAFRRLWRWGGPQMDERIVMMVASGQIAEPMGYRGGDPFWPQDEKTPEPGAEAEDVEEKEDPRARGGLASYSEALPPQREPRPRAYEVLAGMPLCVAEMKRQMRTQSAASVDYVRHVVDALRRAKTEALGADAAFAELSDAVVSGRAGKVEYIQLLDLLAERAEGVDPAAAELLADLVRTVNPSNSAEVMRLAGVFAGLGETDRARRLYQWCATLTGGQRLGVIRGGGANPHQLVKEAKANLTGDDLLAVVETILEFAAPDDQFYARESFELLVFDTWEEILGPGAALERCRQVCEDITDVRKSLRRRSAKRAATLYARAGEHERAVACLEIALCKLPTDDLELEHVFYATQYERPGTLSRTDFRSMFPSDTTEWTDATGWLRESGKALTTWLADERLHRSNALQALSLIAVRLHQAGDTETARRIVVDLCAQDASASDRLWIVDAAREVGEHDAADAIERALLQEAQLNVARVHEVVARTAEADGPEAALAVGEKAAEYTLHPGLLAELVTVAEAAGKPERVDHWQAVTAAAKKARAELRSLQRARSARARARAQR